MDSLRLLVVDDDSQMLDLLELSLSLQGFDVRVALSGEEALNLAQTNEFDVIVMDVLMAPMDGFETMKRMYLALGTQLPPVVYLSGLNCEDQMPRLGALHRSTFLMKPFRPSQLAALIRVTAEAKE